MTLSRTIESYAPVRGNVESFDTLLNFLRRVTIERYYLICKYWTRLKCNVYVSEEERVRDVIKRVSFDVERINNKT
jgi:hypothetical protein